MVNNLTDNQINFLLNYFFVNDKFAGWKNIATKLIKDGKCIVAGDECIWKGGVGNFIEVKETEEAVGCVQYIFSLQYFLSSNFYIDFRNSYLEELKEELKALTTNIEDLTKL